MDTCTWEETIDKQGYITWYLCDRILDEDERGNTSEWKYCPYCGKKIKFVRIEWWKK